MSSSVEIPKMMRLLQKDRRGLPIPIIVMRDIVGQPIFAANDFRMVAACVNKKLCSICGRRLTDKWFVGGSRAFLHEDGVFIDSPVHYECAEYALQVCPFMAAPFWARSVAEQQLKTHKLPDHIVPMTVDYAGPRKPEWFGLGRAHEYITYELPQKQYRHKVTKWAYLEFWRNGFPCNAPTKSEVDRLLDVTPLLASASSNSRDRVWGTK